MATTGDDGLFDSALTMMIVRLVIYANAMKERDREAMDKAERFVKRSIDLAHKHGHSVEKLLDTAYTMVVNDGVTDKFRKYLGFIVSDMKVADGIITKADDNIS